MRSRHKRHSSYVQLETNLTTCLTTSLFDICFRKTRLSWDWSHSIPSQLASHWIERSLNVISFCDAYIVSSSARRKGRFWPTIWCIVAVLTIAPVRLDHLLRIWLMDSGLRIPSKLVEDWSRISCLVLWRSVAGVQISHSVCCYCLGFEIVIYCFKAQSLVSRWHRAQ